MNHLTLGSAMRCRPQCLTTSAVMAWLVFTSPVGADVVDTFEEGVNQGNWTYQYVDLPTQPQAQGGNPGAYMQIQLCCDAFAPYLHTVGDSVFTGDYRARNVGGLQVDIRVFVLPPDSLFIEEPLNLVLGHDNGTPDDSTDDWGAVFIGGPAQSTPLPGSFEWRTISFEVPSQADELPDGWVLIGLDLVNPVLPPDAAWDVLIRDVAEVAFYHGLPLALLPPNTPFGEFIIEFFQFGADNVTLTFAAAPGDLNGDGVIDAGDLAGLLGAWGPCAPTEPCSADLNGDGAVNAADLAILLGGWTG